MEKEQLLDVFMGPKSEKLKKKNFSLWAFLFRSYYFAYRKMMGMAIVCELVTLFFSAYCTFVVTKANDIVSVLSFTMGAMVCVNLAIALTFGSLYRNYANKQVDRILNNDKITDKEKVAKKVGGTSIVYLIIFLILDSMVMSLVSGQVSKIGSMGDQTPNKVNVSVKEDLKDDEQKDDKKTDNSDTNKEDKGSKDKTNTVKFKGMFSYDSDKVKEHFKINIPETFKEGEISGYLYTYSFDKLNINSEKDVINLNYGILDRFTDAEDLYKQMKEFYKDKDSLVSEDYSSGGLVWYKIVRTINQDKEITTYFTEVDENILLYQFETNILFVETPTNESQLRDKNSNYNIYKSKIDSKDEVIKSVISEVKKNS